MKKNLFSILLALLILFQSCQGLLDEKIVSGVTPDYLNTKEGFEGVLKAAYSSLRSFYGTERGMSLTVFGTDSYTHGGEGDWYLINDYSNGLDPSVRFINEIWTEFYRAINVTNTVIAKAPTIPGLPETLKTTRIAEARFLRAHFHFILVQFFGAIPLQLEEITEPSTEAHRASVSDVYTAIVQDLEFAIQNLPKSFPEDYGRATKPAAEHLLARVHLTRATMDKSISPIDEYQKAAELSQSVITNYQFKLLEDFSKVFEQGSGEVNDEVIWAIQYTNNPLTNTQPGNAYNAGNNAHHFFLMDYETQKGMKRDIANGRSFKRFKPTNYTLGLWNREIDARYSKSFKTVFYSNDESTIPKDADGKPKFKLGDTAVWLPGVELPAEVLANKPFKVFTPSSYDLKIFPSLNKFLDPLRADQTASDGSRDFLAFRLAETYLIASEALFMLGSSEQAVALINTVRRRGAWPGKEDLMGITPDKLSIEFILDERERELSGEQFRWFDLVRTGTLVDRVKKYNMEAAPNIKPFHQLRPIPQDQIDRTHNLSGEPFLQNDGY